MLYFNMNVLGGVSIGFLGYTLFVVLDTIIKKYLANDYSVFQINFYICLFSFIPTILTIYFLKAWNTLKNDLIFIQLLRGIFGLISGAFVVNSFRSHALNEIYPIMFSAPLFLIILSHFFLGEKVGIRRWSAVLVGFMGVLIVSRPGTIHFTTSYLGLFVSAFLIAINIALVRKFSKNHSSISFTFYAFLSAAIINGLLALNNYMAMTFNDTMILILCGIICGVGGNFLTMASKNLESSVFAPIQYTQLFSGIILGYLVFSDLPDIYEIIGSIVIILSGVYIIYRETIIGVRPFNKKETRFRDEFNRGH